MQGGRHIEWIRSNRSKSSLWTRNLASTASYRLKARPISLLVRWISLSAFNFLLSAPQSNRVSRRIFPCVLCAKTLTTNVPLRSHQNIIHGSHRGRHFLLIQHLPQIDLDGAAQRSHRNIIGRSFKWIFGGLPNFLHREEHPAYQHRKWNGQPHIIVAQLIKFLKHAERNENGK